MALTIQLSGSSIPFLGKLKNGLPRSRMNLLAAQSMRVAIQRHLYGLEKTRPNKMGFPRAHWWEMAGNRTTATANESYGEVSVALEGFRYQYEGGTIRPINVKALTIPIHPDAYGQRARKFKLHFVPAGASANDRTVGYLVRNDGKSVDDWYYVLKSSVSKGPDHSVIPPEDALRKAATDGVKAQLEALGL